MDENKDKMTNVNQYVQTSYPQKPDLINKPKQNRNERAVSDQLLALHANIYTF